MKSKLLSFRLAMLPIVVFFIFTEPARAGHSSGAELTYTHNAGGIYHFKYVVYRECFMTLPPTVTLLANSLTCGVNTSFQLQSMQLSGTNITLICPGSITHCYGGNAPGFEKWVYEGDVVMPGQCIDWIFSISDCCRSLTITTINGAGGEGEYTEARLNNQFGDNNSPQFTNDIIPYIPLYQDFHYNHGMFDPDGDSLVYTLICARSAPVNCVDYNPGYSALQPISSITPITFDNFTGDLHLIPTAMELGVIVYEIKDYRNGIFMGSVMRDVIIYPNIMNADNPTLTGMNGTSQQIVYVFPDDTLCFDIFSNDTTPQDTLTLTWNQVIPGATFTTAGTPHPTGTFCWTPTMNDVRSQPYMFTAQIRDNKCELNAANIYSYYIYVSLDSSLVLSNKPELFSNSNLSIYPNPSDGNFTLSSVENISSVKIFDHSGKTICTNKPHENLISIDGAPGIYWIEIIYNDGRILNQKLLIKK